MEYYRPYKQDSTSTKKRLILGQDQYTGCRTNKTNKTIGRGVAELRNYTHTKHTYVLIYLCTKRTDVPNFTIEEFMYLKTAVFTFRQFSSLQ